MHSQRPPQRLPRTLDPALIGVWSNGVSTIAFEPDGWMLALGQNTAQISPDGGTFTIANTRYSRSFGTGSMIQGAWQLTLVEDGVTLVEDWYFRSDGTYTSQWTANGAFDSIFFGYYTYQDGLLSTRERRAAVMTGPGNAIHLEVPFGENDTGTYVLPSQNTLVLTFGGLTETLNRL